LGNCGLPAYSRAEEHLRVGRERPGVCRNHGFQLVARLASFRHRGRHPIADVLGMLDRRIGMLVDRSLDGVRGSAKLIESFMFNMTPNDPRALAVAVVTLVGAALLAGYGPARKASRIDPTTALRHE